LEEVNANCIYQNTTPSYHHADEGISNAVKGVRALIDNQAVDAVAFLEKSVGFANKKHQKLLLDSYIQLLSVAYVKSNNMNKAINLELDYINNNKMAKDKHLAILAGLYLAQKEYQNALNWYLKIPKERMGDVVLNNIAELLLINKEPQKALEYAQRALDLASKDDEGKYVRVIDTYVKVKCRVGEYKSAREKVEEVRSMGYKLLPQTLSIIESSCQ
jgi:tetratricopeptide (TPR) repeat protein